MPNVSDLMQVLTARFNDFVSKLNSRDWDRCGTFFTLDAVMYAPDGMPVNGRLGKYFFSGH